MPQTLKPTERVTHVFMLTAPAAAAGQAAAQAAATPEPSVSDEVVTVTARKREKKAREKARGKARGNHAEHSLVGDRLLGTCHRSPWLEQHRRRCHPDAGLFVPIGLRTNFRPSGHSRHGDHSGWRQCGLLYRRDKIQIISALTALNFYSSITIALEFTI